MFADSKSLKDNLDINRLLPAQGKVGKRWNVFSDLRGMVPLGSLLPQKSPALR
ncbi:MAG: hypothetical protein ABFC77_09990 [Thermoguttaceae bacterium]